MIDKKYLKVLRKIVIRLKGTETNWVVTGSLGFALQGVKVTINDIDLQTDEAGAYQIEKCFIRAELHSRCCTNASFGPVGPIVFLPAG